MLIISNIGFIPAIAAPQPAPIIADSDIGVSIIRSFPNSSKNPFVIEYAPPYSAISYPIIKQLSLLFNASLNPREIASLIVNNMIKPTI